MTFTKLQSIRISTPLLLIAIFTLCVSLRLFKLEERFSFNAEYNYKLWPVKEIIYDHKVRLIGIEAVSYLHHLHYPPLALYIFSPLLFFTSANPLSIEIFLILINGMNAVLLFFLGRQILNEKFGVLAAFIYSISFFIQRYDRFIWVVGPIITFTLIYSLLINRLLKESRSSPFLYLLLGFIVGLALNFHFQASVLVVSTLILLSINRRAQVVKQIAIFVVGLTLPILPILIFELRHNFYNFQGVLLLANDSGTIARSSISSIILKTIVDVGALPLKIAAVGIRFPNAVYLLSFIFQLLTFAVLLNKLSRFNKARKFIILAISIWALAILTYPLVQNSYYSVNYYLIFLIPIFVISFAYLLSVIKRRSVLAFICILILFTVINLLYWKRFAQRFPYSQQLAAVEWIVKNAPNNHFEIKFTDVPSEELAFLFYHAAKRSNYPYEYIHFVEPWHEDESYDFQLAISDSKISVTKK